MLQGHLFCASGSVSGRTRVGACGASLDIRSGDMSSASDCRAKPVVQAARRRRAVSVSAPSRRCPGYDQNFPPTIMLPKPLHNVKAGPDCTFPDVRGDVTKSTGKRQVTPAGRKERKVPNAAVDATDRALRVRIREYLLDNIISARWPAGRKLPTEAELGRQFNASRMTISNVMRELQNEGFLVRGRGRGSFVGEPRAHHTKLYLTDVKDEILARGNRYSIRILALEKRFAGVMERSLLSLDDERHVFYMRAIHCENERPVQLETRYVNPKMFSDFDKMDFEAHTPFWYLMHKYPFPDSHHLIRAIMPDREEAEILCLDENTCCLCVERTTSYSGKVVNNVKIIGRSDIFYLEGDSSVF
jgi:GntR family histidine utilization transcriptional repressor